MKAEETRKEQPPSKNGWKSYLVGGAVDVSNKWRLYKRDGEQRQHHPPKESIPIKVMPPQPLSQKNDPPRGEAVSNDKGTQPPAPHNNESKNESVYGHKQ